MLFLFSILLWFSISYSYILPQTFKDFQPLGIYNHHSNYHHNHQFNLGVLPLLLWYDNKHKPNMIINSCKHLGHNLKNSKIINNCLVCPSHHSSYNRNESIGTTIIKDGLIWWAYKPHSNNPPSLCVFKEKGKDYQVSNFKLDIHINFINCILNILYINENSKFLFRNKKLFIKNENIKMFFKYPYTLIFSYHLKFLNMKSTFMINLFPITNDITRLYITIKSNNSFLNFIHSLFIKIYLYKLKNSYEKTYNNFIFKNEFIFKDKTKKNNLYLEHVYNLYRNYMSFHDVSTIKHFLLNRNFY
jgi:hypothetical protein